MTSCRWCRKSGWLVRLSENELCCKCSLVVVSQIQNHYRRLRCAILHQVATDVLDEKVLYTERVLQEASALLAFEDQGMPTTKPPPLEVVACFSAQWNALLAEQFAHRSSQEDDTLSSVEAPDVPVKMLRLRLDKSVDVLGRFSKAPDALTLSFEQPDQAAHRLAQ